MAHAAQAPAYSAPSIPAASKNPGQYYAATPVVLARPHQAGQYYATPVAFTKPANPIGQYYAATPIALAKVGPSTQYYAGGYDGSAQSQSSTPKLTYSQPALVQAVIH